MDLLETNTHYPWSTSGTCVCGLAVLRVCEAFLDSKPTIETNGPRAFVYISAEDCTRPLVPTGYIKTKREAELLLEKMIQERGGHRGVYIRPSMCHSRVEWLSSNTVTWSTAGLIYHPHFRPIISPVAALLDLSATMHAKAPAGFPTPSGLLRALGSVLPRAEQSVLPDSHLDALARALTLPPIHVDHVAEAICIAVDNARTDVEGPYGVREMRELIGWHQKGQQEAKHA